MFNKFLVDSLIPFPCQASSRNPRMTQCFSGPGLEVLSEGFFFEAK